MPKETHRVKTQNSNQFTNNQPPHQSPNCTTPIPYPAEIQARHYHTMCTPTTDSVLKQGDPPPHNETSGSPGSSPPPRQKTVGDYTTTTDTTRARSRWMPIESVAIESTKTPAPTVVRARNKARAHRKVQRLPSNDFVPRGCSHCGMSFIPRISEENVVSEFCSGECEHTFAYLRHRQSKNVKGELEKK